MLKRNRRQKASDVFRESQSPFGDKVSFGVAFPEIEDLTVEVKESGVDVPGHNRIYTKQFLGEYIDCSNSLCYDGGFCIGEILREMVRNRQSELETSRSCQGNEGSPKGGRLYRKCLNDFKIKISLTYKEASGNDIET